MKNPRPVKKANLLPALPLLAIALLGMGLVLYFTRLGPGLSSDSVAYLQGALNLRHGYGYMRFTGEWGRLPITGFPPVFSAALAALGCLGLPELEAGRWLNSLLFGANLFLMGWLVQGYTRSALAGWLAAALGALYSPLILAHGWVMSEALFIFWMLLALAVFGRAFSAQPHRVWLGLSGLVLALLLLTRYAGLALLGTLALAWLFWGHGSFIRRILDTALLSLVALLPLGVWFARNASLAGTAANRAVAYYSIPYPLVAEYLNQWTRWFFAPEWGLPWRPRLVLAALLVLGLAFGFIWSDRQRTRQTGARLNSAGVLPWALLLFLPLYMLSLLANTLFFDASTGLAAARRFVAPAYVAAVLLFVICAHRLVVTLRERAAQPWLSRAPAGLALLYAVLLLAFHAKSTAAFLTQPVLDLGLTNARLYWQDVTGGLQKIDPAHALISNDPQLLYVLCGRPAYRSPVYFNRFTNQVEADFQAELELMRQRLKSGAVLVLFSSEPGEEPAGDEAALGELTQGLKRRAVYSRAKLFTDPSVEMITSSEKTP